MWWGPWGRGRKQPPRAQTTPPSPPSSPARFPGWRVWRRVGGPSLQGGRCSGGYGHGPHSVLILPMRQRAVVAGRWPRGSCCSCPPSEQRAWLGQGLAAEELEREGAEEGGDAVLAKQVQLDELGHRARERRLQQLHRGARGSCGLQGNRRHERTAVSSVVARCVSPPLSHGPLQRHTGRAGRPCCPRGLAWGWLRWVGRPPAYCPNFRQAVRAGAGQGQACPQALIPSEVPVGGVSSTALESGSWDWGVASRSPGPPSPPSPSSGPSQVTRTTVTQSECLCRWHTEHTRATAGLPPEPSEAAGPGEAPSHRHAIEVPLEQQPEVRTVPAAHPGGWDVSCAPSSAAPGSGRRWKPLSQRTETYKRSLADGASEKGLVSRHTRSSCNSVVRQMA